MLWPTSAAQGDFYNVARHRVVAFIKGRHSLLCVDRRFLWNDQKYLTQVQPSQVAWGIMRPVVYVLEDATVHPSALPMKTWYELKVAIWQGKKFIFIDQCPKHLPSWPTKIYVDFLVVEENAFADLQRILDRFAVGVLVVGASNTIRRSQQLQEEAVQRGLAVHALRPQGALAVSW